MTTEKDPIRTAFEASMKQRHDGLSLGRYADGTYMSTIAQDSWSSWQASRKQMREDVIQELSGMSCNNATAKSAIKLCIEAIGEMK